MSARKQKAIEAGLRRRMGMSEEKREDLKVKLEQFNDWTATCRKCGATLTGTLADMKGHTCG